ncbi:hypothetical protein D8M04_09410 [Oceanobacillus piezotolerans]|uniref:Spore coat protein CotO n=1 Tax=Oceanobacillus piezotolerans TaxID=2448030 RepID=A0A498D6K3_9BACI|nr:CotO family spore coat protein [Oceanobacillus piezotolerans]RLL45076.1 hypothetical protein D8M04_09410 [Oceanobacillus piezotolerans]
MKEKRYAKGPVLFINQPSIAPPRALMQDHYVTPRKSKEASINDNKSTVQRVRPKQNMMKQRIMDKVNTEEMGETESSTSESTGPTYQKEKEKTIIQEKQSERKQFKDLSLEEKVNYFLDTSDYAPKLKCEIKVNDKSYKGFIQDFKEGIVYMQTGRRSVEIDFKEISQIRLLGF